ncbi:hypothetical protein K438DRAFT_1718102 [Mycena galopus ATCC 62051]|nr:hypothetical protein K438DRAFT_1718102 [Mycena galopus ATCC 62051]
MQVSDDERPLSKSRSDLVSMDIDEDPQSEEEQVEVDILPDAGSDSEASEPAEAEGDVEEPEEYELEDEDDEIQESRSPSVLARPPKSPLKIKLKVRGGAVTRGRRTRATAAQVQSEDSSESSEEEMPQNVRLTKRQAALAKARKGVASSETSADEDQEPAPSIKKRGAALDPSEVALRKEESARKRRNVSEKKLQNEKAETINRLLKKQSRPRNKRTTALSTATPIEVPTPVAAPSERAGSVGDGIDEKMPEAENDGDASAPPNMYRWISTSRAPTASSADSEIEKPAAEETVMSISFCIPASVSFPFASFDTPPPAEKPKVQPALCGVAGCGKDRRYRLVGGEWGVGACGMVHLKLLEGR